MVVAAQLVAPVPCQGNRCTRSPTAVPRPFPVPPPAEVAAEELEEEWEAVPAE